MKVNDDSATTYLLAFRLKSRIGTRFFSGGFGYKPDLGRAVIQMNRCWNKLGHSPEIQKKIPTTAPPPPTFFLDPGHLHVGPCGVLNSITWKKSLRGSSTDIPKSPPHNRNREDDFFLKKFRFR